MHYMFRSKVTTNNLLSEISRHLKDHGLYIATTMDCRTLAHYVRKALHGPYPGQEDQGPETIPGFSSTIEDEQVKILIKNEFDQALLSIRLSIDMANKLLVRSTDTSEEDGLGIEYHFSLFDSEIEAAVDVPEYLVPLGKSFKNMLTENGLKVYKIQNFHEYVNEKLCSASNLPIAEKMKIWNFSGSISTAEWAIMRLYNVVMLQKDGITHTSHTQDISTPLPPFESNTNSPPSSPPLFMPCSPIYRYFVPATPEWIIPEEEFLLEDDVMDPTILALQKRADLAKQLCGGEEIWDALDEDEVEKWMEIAKSEEKMELHRDGTLPHPSNKRKLLSNSQEATEEETPEQEFKRRKQ